MAVVVLLQKPWAVAFVACILHHGISLHHIRLHRFVGIFIHRQLPRVGTLLARGCVLTSPQAL